MTVPLVYHPDYSFPFPTRHRFAMEKFARLADYLRGTGILTPHNSYRPGPCRQSWLTQTHCPEYLKRFYRNTLSDKEHRQMNLPCSVVSLPPLPVPYTANRIFRSPNSKAIGTWN